MGKKLSLSTTKQWDILSACFYLCRSWRMQTNLEWLTTQQWVLGTELRTEKQKGRGREEGGDAGRYVCFSAAVVMIPQVTQWITLYFWPVRERWLGADSCEAWGTELGCPSTHVRPGQGTHLLPRAGGMEASRLQELWSARWAAKQRGPDQWKTLS